MSEKMLTRQVTATCRDCGIVEQAAFAGPAYRCCGCAEKFASRIRRLADDGLNSYEIAAAVGISQTAVSRWCREFCIETYGLTTRKRKPSGQAGAVRGIGKKPADLMPSAEALAAASIWSFALHARPDRKAPEDEAVELVEVINNAAQTMERAMRALDHIKARGGIRAVA